jgi:pyrimidine-nucleoside phosphorylase
MIPAILISKKRDGLPLDSDEIEFMIAGYARGEIPDYQMSALAMAIYLQGMDPREIADLTDAMIRTGVRMERVSDRPRVDKHSTGGLGDKTSLILAPLLACCDLEVPMISGRGLGITGGTLDKLEAIPGFRCDLSLKECEEQLRRLGCFITGATDNLVPADKKLYALRDVTGTVPSIALITASIMSKKIAETLDALILDVKCGSGAFLATEEQATKLAESLIAIGQRAGVATTALITDMEQPLGAMVGNACEVDESIEVLDGRGPNEVRELTIELAARAVVAVGKSPDVASARYLLVRHLDSGRARECFDRMVAMQGGESTAPRRRGRAREWSSPRSGIVSRMDGQRVGQAIIAMGGGRTVAGQAIDHSVGLEFLVRLGDTVHRGDPLIRIFCDDSTKADHAERLLHEAVIIGDSQLAYPPLWREHVQ